MWHYVPVTVWTEIELVLRLRLFARNPSIACARLTGAFLLDHQLMISLSDDDRTDCGSKQY
jgi:hypothetical protein